MFIVYRVAVAGYCNKIYKVTTDDVENATKFKEAPQMDTSKILDDEQTLRDRENQSKYVTIPKEVCQSIQNKREYLKRIARQKTQCIMKNL